MDTLAQYAHNLFGLQLTAAQLAQLQIYEQELLDWNQRFNLTAIRDQDGIRLKHFLDSFSCVLAWRAAPPRTLVDVGTGAGFPGLVLKILYPEMQVTLVESVGKKARFCQHMIDRLALDGVQVLSERAETLGQNPAYREHYDWAVARAVARMNVLMEYLLPLTRRGGHVLAQKGASGPAEAHRAERAIRILGGHLHKIIPLELPGITEDRFLIIVDKVASTPREYPRSPGTPRKQPL